MPITTAMVPPGTTPPPPEGPRKYATVIITYVACASFHASREAYVAVKGDFQRRLFFPTRLLGLLDTTFLVAYGVGLLFSGSVGARFGNKKVASLGLAGTAIVLVLYGLLSTGWLVAHPNDANEAWRQVRGFPIEHVPLTVCPYKRPKLVTVVHTSRYTRPAKGLLRPQGRIPKGYYHDCLLVILFGSITLTVCSFQSRIYTRSIRD